MRALILIHRWLGVAFCLLFAMWFASGAVMHFVPFPALTDAERYAGLAPLQGAAISELPEAAVRASRLPDAARVRLVVRPDGPVYVIEAGAHAAALRTGDLAPAAVRSPGAALAIAADHARRRGLDTASAGFVALADHDQWTVPNNLDPHRPLHRVALNDRAGTELYVSSQTGEVVRDTTRRERAWNYAGSVVHWIYPTALRRDRALWDTTVWTLSLAALVAALAGAVLGVVRMRWRTLSSPYRGWHAWHHALGVISCAFVLTWIFSGWLSMDHGRLFSTGRHAAAKGELLAPALTSTALNAIDASSREVEWFVFGGRAYRRERVEFDRQHLRTFPRSVPGGQLYLDAEAVGAVVRRLSEHCEAPDLVPDGDAYRIASSMPGAPVYRVVCGDTWFHVDGANGALLETLDGSRRAYRWLYSALHTLDFPALTQRPALRTAIVALLCAAGFAFSVTAVVIGWRRLRG